MLRFKQIFNTHEHEKRRWHPHFILWICLAIAWRLSTYDFEMTWSKTWFFPHLSLLMRFALDRWNSSWQQRQRRIGAQNGENEIMGKWMVLEVIKMQTATNMLKKRSYSQFFLLTIDNNYNKYIHLFIFIYIHNCM